MALLLLFVLGLLTSSALALPQIDNTVQAASAVAELQRDISISAVLASPTFVSYSKPKEKIQEFIALGDSYTAGTGCNGNSERLAGDALRGQRAYPMQMSTDDDHWAFVNHGDRTLPRFSFHAYTGDKSLKLIDQQLKQGEYKDDKNLPRNQPFGKPQVAVLTIGGNDARLSHILNDCVYRIFRAGNCDTTLGELQKDIDNGSLRRKVTDAFYRVASAGREANGANPQESFQVYVPEYITFFDDAMSPECDKITWAWWPWWWSKQPKLTKSLRMKLNDMTRKVNEVIKAAAKDLESMGIIYVDGLQDLYNGHRFCEPGATKKMTESKVWFWSVYNKMNTPSEGPGDSNAGEVSEANISDLQKQLLDFIFPGEDRKVPTSKPKDSTPPWGWKGAEKYPDFDSLLDAMRDNDVEAKVRPPFGVLRSFHPKATAYKEHARVIFAAMGNNREAYTGDAYTGRCKDWEIKNNKMLMSTCTSTGGNWYKTKLDLNQCLYYDNKALHAKNNGKLMDDCRTCEFVNPNFVEDLKLWCVCQNDADHDQSYEAAIKLDEFLTVEDNGHVKCFNHVSDAARR